MPFRARERPRVEDFDPLARFFALEQAFDAERGWGGDRVPLRLAAANLILAPGEPAEIAAAVRAKTERLDAQARWYSSVSGALRLLIAAILLERGDEPEPYLAEVERVRAIMRELGLRRSEVFETVSILALRIRNELAPIERAQVERMVAIHAAMKRHHRWLTGAEDYPACAFLVGQAGTPEAIGARANAIYEALREQAGAWAGDPLQTASNMLALSALEPTELAGRFANLAAAFAEAGLEIRIAAYDELATLCFLARPIPRIIETVLDYRERIRERFTWMEKSLAFSLGSNLAYVRLVGADTELGSLADAKILLDMQTIIAARAAAVAAAAAGSA